MYKNQLQELAQRSCFNLPTYAYVREGPDHAPRFKATVNFNGETFESPTFCTTLRQAEHSAAEVALSTLSKRGPSRFLAAKVLDETGVYKNLLQETSQRAGLNLPVYTIIRSGPGHVPVFSCTVELGRMSFTGEPAKTKKQAQKNAAMAAWSALRQMSYQGSSSSSAGLESEGNEEQEQVVVARTLATLCPAETNSSTQNDRHRGHRRIAPIRRPTKSASRNISLYPMQYQRNYSKPEIAIYQMWPQEEASQKKNCMLTTPIAPISPPVPRVVQSILQPEHGQYVSARDQERIQPVPAATVSMSEPSFFSNPLVPTAVASRTQVAKQEIKVEGTQTGDANGNVRKVNTQSNVSGIFPFEAPKDPVSGDSQAEVFLQETKQELDKQKNVDSDPSIMHPVQLEGGQSGHFEWTAHGSMDAGHEVRATNRGQAEFQWNQLQGHGFSQSPKSHHPSQISPVMVRDVRVPSTKAPVRFPTVGPALPASSSTAKVPASAGFRTPFPACSPRPWQRGMIAGRVPSNMMAPAVQIRSVVPVCAAPPTKEVPDAGQHGFLPVAVEGGHLPKDVKVVSLELGKLQI